MIKVQWHCFLYMLKFIFTWNVKDSNHAPCKFSEMVDSKWTNHKHFCSCGYNNDGKTWADVKKEYGIG